MLKLLFLDDIPGAKDFRAEIIELPFTDYQSEFDSVIYPGIASGIPYQTQQAFWNRISDSMGHRIDPRATFARMMTSGIRAPHRVHTDAIMGEFSAHLYLSRHYIKGSGTAFYYWKYDGSEGFSSETDPKKIRPNNLEDWEQYSLIPAKFGRLLIHDAALWHCAHPLSGFGSSPEDARLVLTCFFNLV